MLAKTVNRPWHHETAKKARTWGTVTANLTGTAAHRAWTSLDDGAGVEWRTPTSSDTYDTTAGRVVQPTTTATRVDRGTTTVHPHHLRRQHQPPRSWLPVPGRDGSQGCDGTTNRPATYVRRPHRLRRRVYGARREGRRHPAAAALKTYNGTTAVYLETGATYDGYGRALTTTDLTATSPSRDRRTSPAPPAPTAGPPPRPTTPTTGFPPTVATTPACHAGRHDHRADLDHRPRPAARTAAHRGPTPTARLRTYATTRWAASRRSG